MPLRRLILAALLCTLFILPFTALAEESESGREWTGISAHVEGQDGSWYTEETMVISGTAEPNEWLLLKVYCPGVNVEKTVPVNADGSFSAALTAEECGIGAGGTIFAYLSYVDAGEDLEDPRWSSQNIDWDCYPPRYLYDLNRQEDGTLVVQGWTDASEAWIVRNEARIEAEVDYFNGSFSSDAFIARPGDRLELHVKDEAGHEVETSLEPADTEIGGLLPAPQEVYSAADVLKVEGWYACFDPDLRIELALGRVEWDDAGQCEKLAFVDGAFNLNVIRTLSPDDAELAGYCQAWPRGAEVQAGYFFAADANLGEFKNLKSGQYRLQLRWYDEQAKIWYPLCASQVPFTILTDGNVDDQIPITAHVENWAGDWYTEATLRLDGHAKPGAFVTGRVHTREGIVETDAVADGEGRFFLELSAEQCHLQPDDDWAFIALSYSDHEGALPGWSSGVIAWDCTVPKLEITAKKLESGSWQFFGSTDAPALEITRNAETIEVIRDEDGAYLSVPFEVVPGDFLMATGRDAAGNTKQQSFEVQRGPDTEIGAVWSISGECYTAGDTIDIAGWYALLDPSKDIEVALYTQQLDEESGDERLVRVGEALDVGSISDMEAEMLEIHIRLWPNEANVTEGFSFRVDMEVDDLGVQQSGEYLLVLRWYDQAAQVYREICRSDPLILSF